MSDFEAGNPPCRERVIPGARSPVKGFPGSLFPDSACPMDPSRAGWPAAEPLHGNILPPEVTNSLQNPAVSTFNYAPYNRGTINPG